MTGPGAGVTGAPTVGAALGAGAAELVAAAAAEVAAACVSVALVWAPQERLVWQPPRVRARDRAAPAGATRLDYAAADGEGLLAWVVEPPRPAAGTLLAFHGNAELAAWGVPWARAVAERTGWRVALPEYRGYAGLGGVPGYAHSARDARAAYDAVVAGADAGPFAVFGHSLGSAVAAELAAELGREGRAPAAVLLQAPFTSVRAMARMTGWPGAEALWRRVGRVHFDTAARVAELDAPVWVAHGALDAIVPVRMGRRVFAAARRPGGLLVLGAAAHNNVPARGGARYWRWLGGALASASPEPPTPSGRCDPS